MINQALQKDELNSKIQSISILHCVNGQARYRKSTFTSLCCVPSRLSEQECHLFLEHPIAYCIHNAFQDLHPVALVIADEETEFDLALIYWEARNVHAQRSYLELLFVQPKIILAR